MKRIYLLTFFVLVGFSKTCFGNDISIATDKEFYNSGEKAQVSIYQSILPCNNSINAVYLELFDKNVKIVKRSIFELKDPVETIYFSLSDLETGYYVLRVYTEVQRKSSVSSINDVLIGVNIPMKERSAMMQNIKCTLYPESGKALINFKTKFAVHLETDNSRPLREKLFVRNKDGLLIGICTTSSTGWGYLDLPIVKDDRYTISTSNGQLIDSLINKGNTPFSDLGFSLRAEIENDLIVVEMRKAENEVRRKVKLQVFWGDMVLHEAVGVFRDDTSIVATAIPIQGMENKLMRLKLYDENGKIVSERLFIIPNLSNSADHYKIISEIMCQSIGGPHFALESFSPQDVNNCLISSSFLDNKNNINKSAGFALYFQAFGLNGNSISYSINDSVGNLLQVGTTIVDNDGFLKIEDCVFNGFGFCHFYLQKQEVSQKIKLLSFIPGTIDTLAIVSRMNSVLMVGDNVKNVDTFSIKYSGRITGPGKEKELENVTVTTKTAIRKEVLENKYVRNNLFRDQNSFSVDVEDDEFALNYTLRDYLTKTIPGLQLRNEKINGVNSQVLIYRSGYVDVFVDESPVFDLPEMSLRDVGYIKFFRDPVRGGMAAAKGGGLLKGSSFVGGLQGSIAIYTRRFDQTAKPISRGWGILVKGFSNLFLKI